MLFNSVEFLYFLPLIVFLFYVLRPNFRIYLLIGASFYFYMSWNPLYLLLMLTTTFTNFFAGILISRFFSKIHRKIILFGSLIINFGLLFYFKYSNFIIENLNTLFIKFKIEHQPIEFLDIILPIGISFYTFHTISYTLDVYKNKIQPERNVFTFILYVSFFPLLVAGPIERFSALMPQFKEKAILSRENFSIGLRMILYGFFLKMVVADNLSILVDQSYANISTTSSINLLLTLFLYSFQIYCDFNGYTTIALGIAKLFNINLTQNFKTPYFSQSLTTFWRKWHITLTTWFRDYIYYPLGGNRTTLTKWILSTLLVFFISGFWHGANWTFVLWGVLHGMIIIIEKLTGFDKKSKSLFINILKGGIVFIVISCLWVLFRSPSIEVATLFFENLFHNFRLSYELPSIETVVILMIFICFDFLTRHSNFGTWLNDKSVYIRWGIYFLLGFLIMSQSGTDMQPFIYFQF